MDFPLKTVKISIREFAMPSPRTGSIDSLSGFGRATQEGIEIHQRVQKARKLADPLYESEVKLSRSFERGGFRFVVEGRMDGLYTHEEPKIEEIKSSFQLRELYERLKGDELEHPYRLQLLTYGYFYVLEHGKIPELSFHLVSTRNHETIDLGIKLDGPRYEEWMNRRLDELVKEAITAEKRVAKRKRIAERFAFPFEKPRSGQIELIDTIEKSIAADERMMIQAPTGLGKTVGVLYPMMKEALSRGQKVIYVTPKNSQHSVAEEAVDRFQETIDAQGKAKGQKLKSLTITAKSKLCMKAEPICNPKYCEYAQDYYTKVAKHELLEVTAKKRKLTARVFKNLAEEYEVCPFELQMDSVPDADAVICDYNYVFSPNSALGRVSEIRLDQEGSPNLVIDEAHNLPSRAMQYYSPSLSTHVLEKMRLDLRLLPKKFAKEGEELLSACIQVIQDAEKDAIQPEAGAKKSRNEAWEVKADLDAFLEKDGELRSFLSRYLESDAEIAPQDPVLRFCFYWGSFTEILEQVTFTERAEFFISYEKTRRGMLQEEGSVLKITCCDASEMLKPFYDEYQHVVAFSATLKPFDFYSRLTGLKDEKLRIAEFHSPFKKSNRKVLIIPQISTKFSERERNYSRIAETIERVAALRPGNHIAFFPSFEFLDRVMSLIRVPQGFTIVRQERNMKNSEVEEILEGLKIGATPTLLFAVQGGVFSEGVDYPGEMVIGAFVVGPPLPNFDFERETMRKYYQEQYQEGFDYAYAYPAMAKAVQAAGRVIRSETDRGVIVLMDSRFLEPSYSKSMPSDWFEEHPRELVSKSILKDVMEFWSLSEAPKVQDA